MSCFDGNIYLRKDYIVCDPDYGVSLTDLIEKVVSNLVISNTQSNAFSCSLLSSCGIGALSDVSSNTPVLNNVLKWTGTEYAPSTLNLSNLATVSDAADTLNNTTDVGRPLVWSDQNKWVPGNIPAATSTVKLNVGTTSDQSDELTLTDNTSTTSKLTIQGSGKIAVTYDSDTNTFTITDFTSPLFNNFLAKVNNGSGTTRYFGETLAYVNFTYSDVSAYASGVNVAAGIKLQWKDGSSYTNLATGIAYTNGGATGGQTMTYTLADGSFADVTKTIFGSESFRLEGQSTQAGAFYSAVSNIKWITNYFYGYVTSKTYSFVAADLTGTANAAVTRLSGGTNVDKKPFDFSFPTPAGKFIWMAVPTSLISGSSFISGGFPLAETTRQTIASVTSGGTTISYTIIISENTLNSLTTINFS
jgi:hypothetical protein